MSFLRPTRKLSLSLVLGISLALGACDSKEQDKKVEIRPVRVQQVKLDQLDLRDTYAGEVKARIETALAFRVGGKIVGRDVDVGARLRKGQTLARLDPTDLRIQVDGARSQLAAAQADHDQAQTDLARYRQLRQSNVVSQAEFDRRTNNANVVAARLDQARSNLRVAENQLAYATLAADTDGVVTAVAVETGQVVTAGQTVVKVARTDEKDVVISVPENRLDELRQASEVRIALWAQPELSHKGEIREISPGVEAVTRTYTVKIAVGDAPGMQLGMTANVHVRRETSGKVVALPLPALYQKGQEAAMWLVDPASGAITLTPVKVAAYHQQYVIVESGLKDGDIVVTAGVHKLDPTQKVRILAESRR
jgi:multidrug efflux system membrane fusion protein